MKFYLVILCALFCLKIRAATITASNVTYTAVSDAYNKTTAGDTVGIPAGSATWNDGDSLVITKDIKITGAGTNSTFILENFTSPKASIFRFETQEQYFPDVGHITFQDGGQAARSLNGGVIAIVGSCTNFRIHHIYFDGVRNASTFFNGSVWGVVDHCRTRGQEVKAAQFQHATWANNVWGDGSWAAPLEWGSRAAIYIEDCYAEGGSLTDMYSGARFVWRFSTVTNANFASHGTGDGAGRNQGPAKAEIYGNQFLGNAFPLYTVNAINNRGGSARVALNTFTNYTKGYTMHYYAFYSPAKNHFGREHNGTNQFDINDPVGIYATGVAGPGSQNFVLVVPGAGWTPQQWKGYMVEVPVSASHPDGRFSSIIKTNTTDTIYVEEGHNAPSEKPFVPGDTWNIRRVLLALGMPGAGQTSLILDKSVYPVPPPGFTPTRDPVYFFLNTSTGVDQPIGADAGILQDYHWMVESNSFNGTSGVGVGTFAQMSAITPTLLYAGFWCTDRGGNWNTTTAAANDGALYVWNGSTWNINWTPFTYPHPLASGAPPPTPPVAPSGLTVTKFGSTSMSLLWTDNSTDEDGFSVERSTTGGGVGFQPVATPTAGSTGYIDNGLAGATTYYYRVAAFNVGGYSAYSAEASGTTDAIVTEAPKGRKASMMALRRGR